MKRPHPAILVIGSAGVLIISSTLVIAARSRSGTRARQEGLRAAAMDPKRGATAAVAGGTMMMGHGLVPPEGPEHIVRSVTFELDVTEVPNAAYDACVREGACRAPAEGAGCASRARGADEPVTCVDAAQAAAYCAWVGKRLPTEEEWEYSARSTMGLAHPWGPASPREVGACVARERACSVASAPGDRGAFGIFDLVGSVREWTASPLCPYQEPGCATTRRAVRGASFRETDDARMTVWARDGREPEATADDLGVRCVKDRPKK